MIEHVPHLLVPVLWLASCSFSMRKNGRRYAGVRMAGDTVIYCHPTTFYLILHCMLLPSYPGLPNYLSFLPEHVIWLLHLR